MLRAPNHAGEGSPRVLRAPIADAAPGRPHSRLHPSATWWVVVGCAAGALLSLLVLPSAPLHDQWAWLVWGREVAHLQLDLSAGPSWKPLPVMITALLSPLGDAAPELWLAVARFGGLLAVAVGFRLAVRLAGWPAGVVAVIVLLSAWLRSVSLGMAEGLMVGLLLWAIDRHLDGRRGHALLLGFAATLIRPEVWPFLALYGAVLLVREPRLRAPAILLLGLAPVLWLAPDLLSGDAMRSSQEAQGLAGSAPDPGVIVRRALALVPWPVHLAALVAVVEAVRRRHPVAVILAAGAAGWVAVEVTLAVVAGYQGVTRFLYPTLALEAVLAGIGVAWGAQVAAQRLVAAIPGPRIAGLPALSVGAVAVALVPLAAWRLERLSSQLGPITARAGFYAQLDDAVERAGGAERLRSCGVPFSSTAQAPAVAWELGVPISQVGSRPRSPGFVLRVAPGRRARIESDVLPVQAVSLGAARFPRTAEAGPWEIRESCSNQLAQRR